MKKTPMQRMWTILRNIALVMESLNAMPRWMVIARVVLQIPFSAAMVWIGFFNGPSNRFFYCIAGIGIAVMIGTAMMIGGGVLRAGFWRKLEYMRRAAADHPVVEKTS